MSNISKLDKRLMKLFLYINLISVTLLLSNAFALAGEAIQSNNGSVEEEIRVIEKKNDVSIPQSFGSSQIDDWYVLDNKNIVIEAARKKYKATFMSSCSGIRFTDSIGLVTMGPYELDKTTTVILPDGRRCHIKELIPYTADMEKQDREAKEKKKQDENPG